jgi:hypothetical protein
MATDTMAAIQMKHGAAAEFVDEEGTEDGLY